VGPVNAQALPPVNTPPANVPPAYTPPITTPPVNEPPPEAAVSPPPAPLPASPPTRRAPPPPPMRYGVEGPVKPAADKTREIKVEKGDTVNNLAGHYMATKQTIIAANKLKKPYELEIGQPLKIPTPKAYVVQSGDTLFAIAHRFTVSASLLAELNDFEVRERLHPGQTIVLPVQYKDIGRLPLRGPRVAAEPEPEPAPAIATAPPLSARPYRRIEAPPSTPPYPISPTPMTPSVATAIPPSRGAPPPVGAMPPVEAAPLLTDAQVAAAGRGLFAWPIRGDTLSGFGPKVGGQRNDGIDIAAPLGSVVQAAAAGDVVYAGNQVPGFGNLVLIRHDNGWVTAYAHLSKTQVKIKDHVAQGDEIGEIGQTGGVDQPELHFEIRYRPTPKDKAKPIDPTLVLAP
jgi:murein DD-endopeptidase MepM/ murein hydrolase activator NlpD